MGKTVLVVDDSTTIRQILNFTLKQGGYTTVEAVDGQDGLSKAKSQPVDLIITDLNMPNKNGIEMVRDLRTTTEHKSTPIVMLSTESDDSKKLEGEQAGVSYWLVKPVNPAQLLKVLEKMLQKAA